jgi:glutaminase
MGRSQPTTLHSPIQAYLQALHDRYAAENAGTVATYIPELANADPEWFGISVATIDGYVYQVGDHTQPFTIQSISKPFVYGLALEDRGGAAVCERIGVEPSGDAFNAISLSAGTGRPFNAMINAGAIAATGLVAGADDADALARLIATLSLYAGRQLSVDRAVCESEQATGHRNRAIAHLLRNFDIIRTDPEPVLDRYFQQCSVSVTCRDLSLMAATLANGGINPVTGERALRAEHVASVLSVMMTCGMYDYAGEWMYTVGLPAKSGVAGGVLAVLPGQLGIGVFSPRLDAHGNSVRGLAVCRELSRDLGLHSLRVARSAPATVRRSTTVAAVRSKRRRPRADAALLDRDGGRVRIYELQGDLGFAAVENAVRQIIDHAEPGALAIVDMRRVSGIDAAAERMLCDLVPALAGGAVSLLFSAIQHHPGLIRMLEQAYAALGAGTQSHVFADLDAALEWGEEHLLRAASSETSPATRVPLEAHDLCRGLDPDAVLVLGGRLRQRRFARGELIVRAGEHGDAMYLLASGHASIVLAQPNGQLTRLATVAPGMVFGELALVGRSVRTADIRADDAVECYVLDARTFDALGDTHPALKIVLLENLLRQAYDTVARLNGELTAIDR